MLFSNNQITLLQQRDEILNIDELEEKYFKVPPLYKAFITTFKGSFKQHKLKINGELIEFIHRIYAYEKKDNYTLDDEVYAFEYFYEPTEEDFFLFNQESGPLTMNKEHPFVYISMHGWGNGFAVGIEGEFVDKIYDLSDGFEFVAESIFELISKWRPLIYSPKHPNLNIDTNLIYKNLHEDFWRIKGDDTP